MWLSSTNFKENAATAPWFSQNHRAAWPQLYRRIYMNAHCGLWQRECDLNTRMRESKSLALPLGYRAISRRAVFEWCPAPYLKGEPQHEHLPHHTAGGKRRCCPATQTPKVRVLLLHYVLHLVAGLFILSPAIRVVSLSHATSGLASWHHVLYHSLTAMSIPFSKFSKIFFTHKLSENASRFDK